MYTTLPKPNKLESDENRSLNWETLGRMVRERAWQDGARALAGSTIGSECRSPNAFPISERY